ncbi:MAG: hypothetical protein WBL35_15310 [Ornithinibacter sp.]
MRRTIVTALATSAMMLATGPAFARADPPLEPASCSSATLVGTNGDDVLVGTPGPDVIRAGSGDDVVYGLGGDDVICGENGIDRLFGGPGADAIDGGNGNDLIVGEDGDDEGHGGRGVDTAFGGGGADTLEGANGDDVVGGGTGADRVAGSDGADLLVGGSGTDTATGGRGSDTCAAEVAETCEVSGPEDENVDVDVSAPSTPVRDPFAVTVTSSASRGVALVLLEVNGVLTADRSVTPAAPSATTEFTLDPADLPNGRVGITAVAYDRDGNEVRSDPTVVVVDRFLGYEGPSTSARLASPTPLSQLAPTLRVVGAPVVEFRHVRQAAEPLLVPRQVDERAAARGVTVDEGGTDLIGGFSGRGLGLEDQLALYAGLSKEADGDPRVTGIRFEGALDDRQRTLLGSLVESYATVPGHTVDEPDTIDGDGPAEAGPTARSRTAPPKPTDLDEAYDSDPQPAPRTATRAAGDVVSDVDEQVYWPTFGQLDTTEYTEHINRPLWFDSDNDRVEFRHDMVWVPGVLDNFGTLNRAYEHDLKTSTGALTLGSRGVGCIFVNPLNSLDDAFYAYREDGVAWETNVPGDADPYFDTDLSDGCGAEDLSVGIRKPEILDDGLAEGHSTHYWFTVDSARGNPDAGDFTYAAQRLTRLGDASCWFLGTAYCTGLDQGETVSGFFVRTGGELVPGITLPVCFTWEWDADPALENNESGSRCGGDSDGDGWDDTVDCAPNDPAVNPGAVDIPNDGIDQNCDGSDLVVGDGTLRFTLLWDNDNDQDLHVIEPDGSRIWYASPGPSTTGGRLDRDDNVGVCGADPEPGGVENTYWPADRAAPFGTYTVEVRQYNSCGAPAEWTLLIYANDVLQVTSSGTGSGVVTFVWDGQ